MEKIYKYPWKTRWELFAEEKNFSIDNVIIVNGEKIANEFHNFFVSIGHNILLVMLTHCFM